MAKTVAEVFDPHANSVGFLRWLMAFMVIFSHAGPLAGFYGGHDLGTQISDEQSLGGVAVAGFFFFSGFLITKSRMGRSTTARYFWRRALRILPAWWATLLLIAFVLAPIAWVHSTGSISGYFGAANESPLTYFVNNMWLTLSQQNIVAMGADLPSGGYTWNGSAWTLLYEFRAYILVGLLGLFGVLANRWIAGSVAVGIILLACIQWTRAGDLTQVSPIFGNIYYLLLFAPFAFGMLFALFGDKIPVDDRVALGAIIVAAATYAFGGWLVFGQYLFCYFLFWFAIRATKLQKWDKHGDFSYGIYIFAWPVMQFAAYFGLQDTGWVVYHVVIVVVLHALAFLSWHLVEKPAMSLKNWTPRPVLWAMRKLEPLSARLKERLIDPAFSTTAYAARMRAKTDEQGVA